MDKEKKIFNLLAWVFVIAGITSVIITIMRSSKKATTESSFGMRSGYVYGNHVYPYPPGGGYTLPGPDLKVTSCAPGTKYNWLEGYCVPVNDGLI